MEQFVNSLTHLIPGLIGLGISYGSFEKKSLASVYWLVSSLLLSLSGLYHLSWSLELRMLTQIFGRLDHILIWMVFATTVYILNKSFLAPARARFYNQLLSLIVVFGIWLKAFFFKELLGWPGFLLYAVTFGLGLFPIYEIYRSRGIVSLRPFGLSILLFISGGIGERTGFVYHFIFHLMVVVGLLLFWKAVKQLDGHATQ